MKVIAFNGSPRFEGNTAGCLGIIAGRLAEKGIAMEVLPVGSEPVRGCVACNGCAKARNGKCVMQDDIVNDYLLKAQEASGIILASPVYFAGVNGTMKAFLDRMFYVSAVHGGLFRHKIGASLAVVRRSGGTATFDVLNHYLLYSEMLVVASNYWTVVHGNTPGQMKEDHEGIQILEVLADNMAWALKLAEHGKGHVEPPPRPKKVFTNFIR